MDVLASTPREHEDWIVAEVTTGRIRLRLRDGVDCLRLSRAGAPADLKPGDVVRLPVRDEG
jgi:hypothetical protein